MLLRPRHRATTTLVEHLADAELRYDVDFDFVDDAGSFEDVKLVRINSVALYVDSVGRHYGYEVDVDHQTHGDRDWLRRAAELLKEADDRNDLSDDCLRAIERS